MQLFSMPSRYQQCCQLVCLKNERQINTHLVIPKSNGSDNDNDNQYGMHLLTVAQLKFELSARGLSTTGLKPVLLARIVDGIRRQHGEPECDEEVEAVVEGMEEEV